MKYICLRSCYVEDVLWRKGEVYELPEAMEKSEKNFKPMGEPQPESKPEPAPELEKTKPDVIPIGMFRCTKCKALHRVASKTGKKHMKYK